MCSPFNQSAGVLQLAEQSLSRYFGQICLEWLCWNPPVSLGVFWTAALCARLAPRRSHRFSVLIPFPLCVQKPSRGYSHSQQERGWAAVNIEHLEICVKFMFHILVVSVFHYQWSAKALKERDRSPIPAFSSVESVTFVLLKGFPGMDSRDAI